MIMMSKKYYIIFFILGLIFLLKFAANTFVFRWDRYSKDINFSKNNELFLKEYKLLFDENFSSLPDSIYINWLKSINCWAEKSWNRKPYFVLFHPIQTEDKVDIVMFSKNRWKVLGKKNKSMYVKIKGYGYGGSIQDENYSIINTKDKVEKAYYDLIFYENNKIKFFSAKLIEK